MPTVHANGITIDYASMGNLSDPAVILLRGAGSQRVRWQDEFLQGLVGHRLRVVTMDNRDAGGSSHFEDRPTPSIGELMARAMQGQPVEPIYTLDDMALDVIGLMDALDIQRAHIVGLSMGGYVGQILAAKHANRVRSYTSLMSSAAVPGPHSMAADVMQLIMRGPSGSDELSRLDHAIGIAKLVAGEAYPLNEGEHRATLVLEARRGVPPGGETRQIMATLAAGDRSALCAQIRVPTLVVHGTADPLVPFAEGEALARLIPGATLKPIAGGGHEITPGLVPILVREIGAFCGRA